jgi:PAS domain S-box-containing protein
VARLRQPTGARAGIAFDVALAISLVFLWLTGEVTLWLHLAYIAVAASAFVRPKARSTVLRATIVSAAGGIFLLRLRAHGDVAPDELLEIPLMTVLAFCFAGFAAQRSRAEESIQEDRSRLVALVDRIPLATIELNERAEITTWNETAAELFGWRADEVIGLENPIVADGEREASNELFRHIRSGEPVRGLEVQRFARDGTPLDLAMYSATIDSTSTLVMYDDVRERRLAQLEREQAERKYRDLVESLPVVTYVDEVDEHATNVYTSPQMTDLLGGSDDWTGNALRFEQTLHPEDRERVMAAVHHSNESRDPFVEEYRLRHQDGHFVWVRDYSSIVEDREGHFVARGFLLDITQQKTLEMELLQAQKMDALGQFAGGIAHDFNNLLTGIGGYADLAGAAADGGPNLARCLDGIKTATAEAASLTASLLTFSRRDVPERRLVDPNDVVASVAEFLQRLLRADVTLDVRLAPLLPTVSAEPTQLKQVVLNLALNARDAMPRGGTLTLETVAASPNVLIRVRDTGHGMDAATRARAFEPFFTTKPEGKGTGLGLAVAYGVVESLGGELKLESEVGRGTTIDLTLPAVGGVAWTNEQGEPPAPAEAGRGRILVVEDRAIVRDLVREVLLGAGFAVEAAPSGSAAVVLASSGTCFDLLLSDVVMPEMSGPELARRLRTAQPELPVLYMSGYTDDVLDAAELAAARTGLIRKPFANGDLVAAVRTALDA